MATAICHECAHWSADLHLVSLKIIVTAEAMY